MASGLDTSRAYSESHPSSIDTVAVGLTYIDTFSPVASDSAMEYVFLVDISAIRAEKDALPLRFKYEEFIEAAIRSLPGHQKELYFNIVGCDEGEVTKAWEGSVKLDSSGSSTLPNPIVRFLKYTSSLSLFYFWYTNFTLTAFLTVKAIGGLLDFILASTSYSISSQARAIPSLSFLFLWQESDG
jgi:hypothetical protein